MASKELYRLTPATVMAATRETPTDQLDDGQGLRLRFPRSFFISSGDVAERSKALPC